MDRLDLPTLCQGMIRIRENASSLLEEAELLFQNNRTARAYSLAYMACEECGKLSILVGAATRIILNEPIDWKIFWKRFRSHSSKASQFLGFARAIPMIQEATKTETKTVDLGTLIAKAAAGVLIGPTLFEDRNSSFYCDFKEGSFTMPSDEIKREMATQMIGFAKEHIAAASLILGHTPDEAESKLRNRASPETFRDITSIAGEAVELTQAVLQMQRGRPPKAD